jgi:linoleoyl-CoA desaturase
LGLMIALIFQVAHVHEGAASWDDSKGRDWHVHQILTSADFSTQKPLANWILGGLNFQVIHHLFPNLSYRHFQAVQGIVKETCVKHGISYQEFPSFGSAILAHFKFLSVLGKKPTLEVNHAT